MKKRTLAPSLIAFLLAVAAAPPAFAATASVLFSRATYWPDDTTRTATIYRVRPATGAVVQLTPRTDNIYYSGGSWSPNGTTIVYEKLKRATSDRSQLFTVDRNGGSVHRITSGVGQKQFATWGPGARIAYVRVLGDQSCLSTIRGDGTRNRTLWCTTHEMDPPQWSADGSNLFVHVDYFGSGLQPPWYSRAYRISARTGAATLLTAQSLDDARYFTFSPDGTHGIYFDLTGGTNTPMMQVDFATDTMTPLGQGYLPRYSKDGSHIAFSREDFGGAPDFPIYSSLYVMNADGSGVTEVTHEHVDGVEYQAADWSDNGTRVLANRNGFMRIIDVATGTQTFLPRGAAHQGSWYQP